MIAPTDLIAFGLTVFHMAWIPGPSWMTTLSAARAGKGNGGAAALAVLGVAVGNVIFVYATGLLKYAGFALPEPIRTAAGLAGCLSLLLLAARMVLGSPVRFGPPLKVQAPSRPFTTSMVIHLVNPNSWTFYISVFFAATRPGADFWVQVTFLGSLAIAADLVFMSVLAIIVSRSADALPSLGGRYPSTVAGVGLAYLGMSNGLRLMGVV